MWKIDVSDWTKINKKSAEFILDQAEKKLRYSIEISDKITNRFFTLIIVLLPGVTAMIGLLVREFAKENTSMLIVSFYMTIIVVAMFVVFTLVRNFIPRLFMSFGRQPKEIATKEMLENGLDGELKELSFILNEIEGYQVKIEYNDSQNRDRLTVLKSVIIVLCAGFIATIVTSVFVGVV